MVSATRSCGEGGKACRGVSCYRNTHSAVIESQPPFGR